MYDKDPDKLNYFEIEGICDDLGVDEPHRFHYLVLGGNLEQDLRLINNDANVVSMCKLRAEWPVGTIILYVESGHAPLAIELPEGVGGGVDGGVGGREDGDGQLESDGECGGRRTTWCSSCY